MADPNLALLTQMALAMWPLRGQVLFVPLASSATARELMRVLAYPKFRLTPAEREELLADCLPYTRVVRIPQPPPTVPACRDPFDLPFMHLAVAGKAKLMVSGDRDLLALAEEFRSARACPIVPLEVFVRTQLSEAPGR
jgi:uncharacterized protein